VLWAHVPTPLSGGTSSLFVVIQGLSHVATQAGDESIVVISHNREATVADARVVPVDYTTNCPREWFTRREALTDFASGALGRRRLRQSRLYEPAIAALHAVRPDVVLLHEGHHATPSIPLWREAWPDVHLVLYVHIPLSRSYFRPELTRLLRGLGGLVFVSRDGLQATERRTRGLPVPAAVVRNGVDTSVFTPSGRVTSTTFRIAFVGELASHKGPDLLVAAVKHLPQMTGRQVELRIIGRPRSLGERQAKYQEELRAELRRLPFETQHVEYVPHAEMPEIYRWADLLCVPSVWHEPFGMVVLEGLACGAVVVASPVGGLREAGGDAACYVDPRDETALAQAIVRFMDDDDLVERTREYGIAYARSNTWTRRYDDLRTATVEWFGIH
jgi:UDP-glucose:(glucosyl)LPS alpha-1,2-glucosyltransferase